MLKTIENEIRVGKFEVRTAYMLACVGIMMIMIFAINNKRREDTRLDLPNVQRTFALQPENILANTLPQASSLNSRAARRNVNSIVYE